MYIFYRMLGMINHLMDAYTISPPEQ
uniref:Uncharacterized protein n=1 Tax=Arundo donax TaxID=35708 RepID=A0A0A8ZS36_ARUDO